MSQMTKSTSPQAAWVANDPLMLLQEKIFLNVTTVKKDLIIYNRVKHFTPNVNKMTMRENYVSTCATMPDHVASASMCPHLPDEAIIIGIISLPLSLSSPLWVSGKFLAIIFLPSGKMLGHI